jgi:hypothetical protein
VPAPVEVPVVPLSVEVLEEVLLQALGEEVESQCRHSK